MSKASVKRELKQYSAEQLLELITEIYDTRVLTAREYLDYYVNPDPKTQIEKAEKKITREVDKVRRGSMRFKISNIKREIERVRAFAIDPVEVAQLMCRTAARLVTGSCDYYTTEAQRNAILNFFKATADYIAANALYPHVRDAYDAILHPPRQYTRSPELLRDLRDRYSTLES